MLSTIPMTGITGPQSGIANVVMLPAHIRRHLSSEAKTIVQQNLFYSSSLNGLAAEAPAFNQVESSATQATEQVNTTVAIPSVTTASIKSGTPVISTSPVIATSMITVTSSLSTPTLVTVVDDRPGVAKSTQSSLDKIADLKVPSSYTIIWFWSQVSDSIFNDDMIFNPMSMAAKRAIGPKVQGKCVHFRSVYNIVY